MIGKRKRRETRDERRERETTERRERDERETRVRREREQREKREKKDERDRSKRRERCKVLFPAGVDGQRCQMFEREVRYYSYAMDICPLTLDECTRQLTFKTEASSFQSSGLYIRTLLLPLPA